MTNALLMGVKYFSIKNFPSQDGFFTAHHPSPCQKMKYRNVLESEGKGNILFLNNTTRHLQMRHITVEHMLDELAPFFHPRSRKNMYDQAALLTYVWIAKKNISSTFTEESFTRKGRKMRYERSKKFHQSIACIGNSEPSRRLKNDSKILHCALLFE